MKLSQPKYTTRKIISLTLAALLAAGAFTGCAKKQPPAPLAVTVEGSIFGGSREEPVQTTVTYDPAWITTADNTAYNSDLAHLCAVLSADIYFREKDLEKGSQNRVLYEGEDAAQYDQTALLKKLGFEDVQYIESHKAAAYAADTNDSATMTLAYANVNGKYDTYVLVLRGCFSSQEWLSIYDPGADTAGYTALTGSHDEWAHKAHHKGVDIAAARAMTFLTDFMAAHDDPKRPDCVLVTGHSRGGSLANLIGAELEDNAAISSCTYTFNAAPAAMDAEPGRYKTIFNLYDAGDLFTAQLPFAQEQFARYGQDISLPGDKLGDAFVQLTGRDLPASLTDAEKAEFAALFGSRFADRASLYEARSITEVFATPEEAAARREEWETLIGADAGLGLEALCTLHEVQPTAAGYELTMDYTDAAWLACYAKTLAYGKSAYEGAVSLFRADEGGCRVADFLGGHLAAISGGHLLARSCLVAGLVNP